MPLPLPQVSPRPTRDAILVTLAFVATAVIFRLAVNAWLRHVAEPGIVLRQVLWTSVGFVTLLAAVLFFSLRWLLQRYQQAAGSARGYADELQFALKAARGGTWELVLPAGGVDAAGTFRLSPQVKTLLGHAPEAWPDTVGAWLDALHGQDRSRIQELMNDCVAGRHDDCEATCRLRRADGTYAWMQVRGRLERDAAGRPLRCTGIAWDIDRTQRDRQRVTVLDQLFQASPEGMVLADDERRVIAANPAFECMSGRSVEELLGRPIEQVLVPGQTPETLQDIVQRVVEDGSWLGSASYARPDGNATRAELRINAYRDPTTGAVVSYGAAALDISEVERSREQLAWLQNYDELTRLPNAHLLQQLLSEALRRAARSRSSLAVLALGLDRFHRVNEALGRGGGDRLLAAIGERLTQALGPGTCAARLHGDRFGVLVEKVGGQREVESAAERVLSVLTEKFTIDGRDMHVSGSIGVSQFPLDGASAEQLLQRAESALDEAKRAAAGGGFRLYRAEISDLASDRFHLETSLRMALLGGDFECHFQPKVRLDSGACVGAEALVRWRLGDCWISPARFIPIAEESGLIRDLGRWMLWEAASHAAEWRRIGLVDDDFQVAVNLAGAQLEAELVRTIEGVLSFCRLPASALVLELTETMVMEHPDAAAKVLQEVRALGVRVSLDDFGTGYTSMTQLLTLAIDELKLDQSFVRGLPGDPAAVAITRSVVALTESMKLRLIAEGIESQAHRRALLEMGCRYGQGHLFGAAMTAADFGAFVRQHGRGGEATSAARS